MGIFNVNDFQIDTTSCANSSRIITTNTFTPIDTTTAGINTIAGVNTITGISTATSCSIKDNFDDILMKANVKPDVNPEVKTMLTRNDHDGELVAKFYKDGFLQSTKKLIPDIKDVRIYNNCAIVVEFMDGTAEKAVVHQCDEFSVEQGISICITKKLVGGSSIYNKLIDRAIRVFLKNDAKRTEEARAKEDRRERKKKNEEKKARREAAMLEKSIEIQKEAYVRAWTEIDALREGKEK